jgi:16S rRNA (cytidine1402-2'-O)-methyltransferase
VATDRTPRRATRPGGRLVLVGTPIGNLGDLSPRAVDALRGADVICAEDTRRTRTLLAHAGVDAGDRLRAVHGHTEAARAREVADLVRAGRTVVYASDAGMPGISDPGERLVRACAEAGLTVEVVPGPSAVLAALVVSGLPAARFRFEGFLPRKGSDRHARLAAVAASPDTVVLFESPHRAAATLADLAAACGADRPAALVRELTKLHEEVRRGTLGDLASAAAAEAPRGEVVLVVGGAPPAAPVDDAAVEAAVRAALAAGATSRDAAAQVAADLGVPKRRAYDVATALAAHRPGRPGP